MGVREDVSFLLRHGAAEGTPYQRVGGAVGAERPHVEDAFGSGAASAPDGAPYRLLGRYEGELVSGVGLRIGKR